MISKTCTFLYFHIASHLFGFGNSSPSPPPFSHFFLPHPCPLKLYPQSKTFLDVGAVPNSAVFCSKSVLIETSSSMQVFSFFDVLTSAPTTTGMALMLLMFHNLLISLFSSLYLSIFFVLFFASSYVCRCSNINYGTTSVILIHYNNIWFLLSHWIITFHKIFTSSFSATPSGACSCHFLLLFRLYFPYNIQLTILATLLCLLLYSFCAIFSHSQYEILLHFSRHIFYKVVIGQVYV